MVGARLVSRPALPRLLPTLTATRSTSTAAPYSMITRGSALWMAAEWPRPDSRSTARAASMPRRAEGTRTRPSTGQSFSCASGSSGTTRSNGASSTRVLAGTRMPASAAIQVASRPTNRMSNRPSGNSRLATLSRCSGSSRKAPARLSWRSSAVAACSSTISTDSLVHKMELSKLLLSTIRRAAWARSAVASTSTGTLPGPTPIAGLPEL